MRKTLNPIPLIFLAGFAPALEAGRHEAFDARFIHSQNPIFGHPALDLPVSPGILEVPRHDLYTVKWIPKMPVIHPYHIDQNLRAGKEDPRFLVTMEFPNAYLEALPAGLLRKLEALRVCPRQVRLFCVIQDQPWDMTHDQPADHPHMEFRPHFFTHPEAPGFGIFSATRIAQVGLFEAPGPVGFVGHGPESCFSAELIVHGPEDEKKQPVPGLIMVSPDNLQIRGLDYRASTAFWTLTRLGEQTAVTLHGLLNDADAAALEAFMPRVGTLRDLVLATDGKESGLAGTAVARQLRLLTRPIIGRREVAARAGHSELTLIGSGFTDAESVQVDGVETKAFRLVDDTRIALDVPPAAATSRDIQVVTPMGASLPLPAVEGPAPLAAPPNLWPYGAAHALTAPRGQAILAKAVECTAGQVYVGECSVQSERHGAGKVEIGLQFDAGHGQPILGKGRVLGPGQPNASGSSGRVRLGVLGIVPEGATRALLYVLAEEGKDGTRALFENVAFMAHPAPAALPPINHWPYGEANTLTLPEAGQAVLAKAVECVAGQVYTGECSFQAEDPARGRAEIGIQFDTGDGQPILGKGLPLGSGLSDSAGPSASRVRMGVRGTVPPGATRALLYVLAGDGAAGGKATFGDVTFNLHPAPAAPLPIELWPYGESTVLTLAGSAQAVKAKAVECRQGEVFQGECFMRSADLGAGKVAIGIQFDAGEGLPVLARGLALGPGQPDTAGSSPSRVRLGVRGVVPEGATRALLYILAREGAAGAQATCEQVTFKRIPTPAPAADASL